MKVFSFILLFTFPFASFSFAQKLSDTSQKTLLYDTVRTVKNMYDTVMVVDTVYEYEYEEPDTVIKKEEVISPVTPRVKKITKPNLSSIDFTTGMLSESFNSPLSFQQSLRYTNDFSSRLFYNIGLGIMIKNQNASFGEQVFTANEYSQGYWKTDTVDMYYQLNVNKDTSWYAITKKRWISKVDSSIITKVDTLYVRNAVKRRNCFAFFEIPLSMRYDVISLKRLTIGVSGGINLGAMVYRNEYIITTDQKDYMVIKSLPEFKPSVRLIAGIDLLFPLAKRWTIIVSPGYSYYAVTPLPVITRSQFFLNTGISFKL